MLQTIQFIDKSFSNVDIDKYHLSLQVSLKGFSFSILDRDRNKFVAFGHYPQARVTSYRTLAKQISGIIDGELALQCAFSHVKVLFATPDYTFVPAEFYADSNCDEWYRFNQEPKKDEVIMSNYIYGNSSYVVYGLPQVLMQTMRSRYALAQFYHQSVPMIEELTLKSKIENSAKRIYLNMMPAFFDLVFADGGSILLYNSFKYQSINDFKYFFLNAVDNLQFSPIESPVYLCGMVSPDGPVIEAVKEYIKNVNYFVRPSHFDYAYGFDSVPSHYFTNLLNLYQCG